MVHENSTVSYDQEQRSGRSNCWRKRVFDTYGKFPTGQLTDRDVMDALGVVDPNLIRPEITRLHDDGLVIEIGKTKCTKTGKAVRVTMLTGKEYFAKGNKNRRIG